MNLNNKYANYLRRGKMNLKCRDCGSKNIAMINHTEKYALCHKCMPDVVYKDGFEFKKKAGNNDR